MKVPISNLEGISRNYTEIHIPFPLGISGKRGGSGVLQSTFVVSSVCSPTSAGVLLVTPNPENAQ